MSLVRFLVYANNFDIEGIAATTSVHQKSHIATWRIKEIVEAYSSVRDNLEKHEIGFPTGNYLKSVITDHDFFEFTCFRSIISTTKNHTKQLINELRMSWFASIITLELRQE